MGWSGRPWYVCCGAKGFANIIEASRNDVDLRDSGAVSAFFARMRPQVVILAAAKVGGIWRPQFPAGTAIEDLRFLSHARRIVMPQSTFNWWATFLGDPDEVVCPLPAFGAWAPDGEAREATLIERDRFTCLPCPEPYRMVRLEQLDFRRRTLPRRFVKYLNRRFGWSLSEPRHS